MPRAVLLLRGINLGSRNRISMPALRGLLGDHGFADAATYLQSGNVVLDSDRDPAALEPLCEKLIADELGLQIPVIARSAAEMAAVVALDPLADVVEDPKRYQVSFLRSEPPPARIEALGAVVAGAERMAVHGREIYAWHPHGVARSKLWARLAGPGLGVPATARNWTTVRALAEMAAGE